MKNLSGLKPKNGVFDWNESDSVDIRKIKKGDVFYECCFMRNYKIFALENSKRKNGGWAVKVKDVNERVVELFLADGVDQARMCLFHEPLFVEQENFELALAV